MTNKMTKASLFRAGLLLAGSMLASSSFGLMNVAVAAVPRDTGYQNTPANEHSIAQSWERNTPHFTEQSPSTGVPRDTGVADTQKLDIARQPPTEHITSSELETQTANVNHSTVPANVNSDENATIAYRSAGVPRSEDYYVPKGEKMSPSPDVIKFRVGDFERVTVTPADDYGLPPSVPSTYDSYESNIVTLAHRLEYIRITDGFSSKVLKKDIGTRWYGNPYAKANMILFLELPNKDAIEFFTRVFPVLKRNYIDTGRLRFGIRSIESPVTNGSITYIPTSETAAVVGLEVSNDNYPQYAVDISNSLNSSVDQDEDEIKDSIVRAGEKAGVKKSVIKDIWWHNYYQMSNGVSRRLNLQSLEDGRYYGFGSTPFFLAFKKEGSDTKPIHLSKYSHTGFWSLMGQLNP